MHQIKSKVRDLKWFLNQQGKTINSRSIHPVSFLTKRKIRFSSLLKLMRFLVLFWGKVSVSKWLTTTRNGTELSQSQKKSGTNNKPIRVEYGAENEYDMSLPIDVIWLFKKNKKDLHKTQYKSFYRFTATYAQSNYVNKLKSKEIILLNDKD